MFIQNIQKVYENFSSLKDITEKARKSFGTTYIWVQYLHFVKVLKMYQEKEKSVQEPSKSVLKNIKMAVNVQWESLKQEKWVFACFLRHAYRYKYGSG